MHRYRDISTTTHRVYTLRKRKYFGQDIRKGQPKRLILQVCKGFLASLHLLSVQMYASKKAVSNSHAIIVRPIENEMHEPTRKKSRENWRVYFLRNEQPSVRRAFPPVGWQSTVEQPAQMTTVWACEKTVVMVKQPGHLTSMKKDRGAGTRFCGQMLDFDISRRYAKH